MTRETIVPYVLVMALLSGTLVALRLSDARVPDEAEAPLESVSAHIAGWSLTDSKTLTPRVMNTIRPTAYLARTYSKGERSMGVFAAYYAMQRAGETMHSPKSCLPGDGWEIWNSRSETVSFEGHPVPIKRFFIRNADQRLAVLYWYQSRKRILSDEFLAKFLLVRDSILDGRTSGSLVRITLPDDPGMMPDALGFAQGLMTELQRCVGR